MHTATLRVIDRTGPTPVLPYICARGVDGAAVLAAMRAALGDLPPDTRRMLRLRGIVTIPAEAYLAVPVPPAPVQIA